MRRGTFVITKTDRWGKYYWVYSTRDTVEWSNRQAGGTRLHRMKAEAEARFIRERHRENVAIEEVTT